MSVSSDRNVLADAAPRGNVLAPSSAGERPVTPATGGGPPARVRSKALARAQRACEVALLQVTQQLRYLGRVGVTGLVLLVAAVACYFTLNTDLRQQQVDLRSEIANAQSDAARQHRAARATAPSAQVQAFLRALPARSELPAITEKIAAQAAAAGLVLERGSYDFTASRSGRFVRARMTFPVQGAYPDVRKFVDSTLTEIPVAALDGLRLERKDIATGAVNADIRFAIFLRNDP